MHRRVPFPIALAVGLLLAPVALTKEEKAPQPPPAATAGEAEVDPIAKELGTVRAMLANAQGKFNRGVAGVAGVAGDGQTEPRTPGQACCSGNIEAINTSLEAIRRMVRERGVCFERKREVENVEIVNLINQDLRSLGNAVDLFEESTNPADSRRALDGCTRSYLNLMRSLKTLPECAAAAEP
jgi:hypothetical protein